MSATEFGILSLNIYGKDNNWGSVLQSWALQTYLNSIGVKNKIVDYKSKNFKYNTAKYPFLNNFPFHIKRFLKQGFYDILDWQKFVERDNKFRKFIADNYIITEKCDNKSISKLNLDGYIVGSDIVWHEKFWRGLEPAYYCDLPSMRNKHNVAYAPSMSCDGFSASGEKTLSQFLNNFRYLSVREPSKCEYLNRFTEKTVERVLDPTLLLGKADYEKFLTAPIIQTKYVLVYCVYQDERLVNFAYEYCKKKGLMLVLIKCCSGKRISRKGILNYDNAGIEEWLTLIKNAEFVLTTSFHASIFSVLFGKKFYTVYNEFGKTKIIDLFTSLGMNNFGSCVSELDVDGVNTDYKAVYKRLDILRKQSYDFIEKALSDIE